MAFQDRAQGLCSQLHLTAVRRPVFIGVGVLLGLILIAAGLLVAFPRASALEIHTAERAQDGLEAPAASADDGGGDAVGADAAAAPDAPAAPDDTALPGTAAQARLCVHVDGKVAAPGVYYLDAGSRIVDAVEAAGGLAEGACTAAVNLAQVLQDGEQVVIPDIEDVSSGAASAGAAPATAEKGSGAAGLVNINTADAAALETLNGIGEATAEKIIADREANGPFKTLEDLKRVSGIGDKKFEALRDAICL
ncbi:ComEA family DNA-binding protein [Adlercreutzia caecimuris]|uniref:ComEA family DNA-binding protein n=1 Tax=Adlercreutzia caecimuris TaxID=671266 RepID=A0A4S4G7P2_9ACTN|nr:ComEA family DNA-binding protein [Adlercreutzia caecimuris]THG38356.1 ComEA family DNA-binding protein [Adlercreutzia caecimuris]